MANKIFIVDESVAGDDLQFVVRTTLPQVIDDLDPDDYVIINTAEQGTVEVTAGEPTVPAQPAAPTVSAITHEGATISWAAPANGGSAITSYTLDWREVGGSSTPITSATSPHGLTGLDPETEYEVRVTAINAVGSSTPSDWEPFETTAESALSPLLEITPSSYTGPTLTGSLPAAAGGFRTITAGDPAPVSAPISLSGEGYMILRVRRSSFSGIIAVFAIHTGSYGHEPWFRVDVSGWSNAWSTSVHNTAFSNANGSAGPTGSWQTVEVWFDGSDLSIAIDGGSPVTESIGGTGTISTNTLYICRDEGSGGETVDLAAARIFDEVPADRAAQRAWAEALTP